MVGVTYFMTPKGNMVIGGRCDLLYDPNGHGDLSGRFVLVCDLKGHRVIRGRRDLVYDSIGYVDLCDLFDRVYDPKSSQGY